MRIGLVGSHGTGKSTIIELLTKALPDYKVLKDRSREVSKEGHGLNFETTNKTQGAFFKQYIKMFENETTTRDLITARTLVDLLAYTRYFHKHGYKIDIVLLKQIEQLLKIKLSWIDLYVYIPIEFEQKEKNEYREGQIEHPEYQKEIDDNIKQILKELGVGYITVTGGKLKRVSTITKLIREGTAIENDVEEKRKNASSVEED